MIKNDIAGHIRFVYLMDWNELLSTFGQFWILYPRL